MKDFSSKPADEQRHEIRGIEHQLQLRQEIYRRQHGGESMPSEADELRISGPGGWSVGARGITAVIVILAVAIIGSNIWSGDQTRKVIAAGTEQSAREHRSVKRSLDINGCINTYDFADRQRLRETWRQGSWASWCPWLEDEDRPSHAGGAR